MKQDFHVHSQKELDNIFRKYPNKLIGLSKGLGSCFVLVCDRWGEIPHDVYREGIFQGGKPAVPPPGWAKKEEQIKNYVGRE